MKVYGHSLGAAAERIYLFLYIRVPVATEEAVCNVPEAVPWSQTQRDVRIDSVRHVAWQFNSLDRRPKLFILYIRSVFAPLLSWLEHAIAKCIGLM